MDRKKLLIEYSNCLSDPAYVIEHYYQTFDKTREGYVPFVLFRRQKELIAAYEKYRYNLILKYRQAGITTVTAAYAAVKTVTANADNPEKILILANKQETAIEFLNKIVEFIKQSPTFLITNVGDFNKEGKIEFPKGAQKHMKFKNKSEIKAVATSKDALRGYAPTIMILDEAAFIEGGQELWSACLASVSTGGKVFLISTPNGQDEIYYETHEGSVNGINKFHITHIKWWEDPRYNKGLKMIKTEDMVNYIQKPEVDKTEEIIPNVITNEDRFVDEELKAYIENLIREGYRPHSDWYEHMCRDMNLNKRMINQELECAIGSTEITIRHKITGIVETITLDEFYNRL